MEVNHTSGEVEGQTRIEEDEVGSWQVRERKNGFNRMKKNGVLSVIIFTPNTSSTTISSFTLLIENYFIFDYILQQVSEI